MHISSLRHSFKHPSKIPQQQPPQHPAPPGSSATGAALFKVYSSSSHSSTQDAIREIAWRPITPSPIRIATAPRFLNSFFIFLKQWSKVSVLKSSPKKNAVSNSISPSD